MGGFPQKWRRGLSFRYSLCIPIGRHTRVLPPNRIAGRMHWVRSFWYLSMRFALSAGVWFDQIPWFVLRRNRTFTL
jgi:hypothetical protein